MKTMKNTTRWSLLLVFLLAMTMFLAACSSGGDDANVDADADAGNDATPGVELYISAAASLTDALEEIKVEYAKESSDTLTFNFAGSGALQKQIAEGAPCDFFISASKAHMDALQDEGLIDEASRKDLLGNALTLIASAEKADTVTMENLASADVESIALGTPDSVPAGKYGQQSLESIGAWNDIQDKLIFAKDVRQVLEYVDTGNADCGFVYASDALLLETGKVIGNMPEDSHDAIVYPAAIIADGENPDAAAAFYEFLQTDYAKGVFEDYGFTVL